MFMRSVTVAAVCALAVLPGTDAFSSPFLAPLASQHRAAVSQSNMGLRAAPSLRLSSLRMDMPSVSLNVVDIESVKSDLMTQLSAGTGLKQAANPANRAEVNEILLKLERNNPTDMPADSPLLNGVWEMLYTGGYGNGFFDRFAF